MAQAKITAPADVLWPPHKEVETHYDSIDKAINKIPRNEIISAHVDCLGYSEEEMKEYTTDELRSFVRESAELTAYLVC